jgi:hypothetical protein
MRGPAHDVGRARTGRQLSGVKDAKARAEGDTSLTENLALVTLVSEYAANERAYRRLRRLKSARATGGLRSARRETPKRLPK